MGIIKLPVNKATDALVLIFFIVRGFNVFSICARRAYYDLRLSLVGDNEVIESRSNDTKQMTTDLPPTET